MAQELSEKKEFVCKAPEVAKVFWDNVDRFGQLTCGERMVALQHVALCVACATRLSQVEFPRDATPK